MAVSLLTVCLGYPLISGYFLYRKYDSLKEQDTKEKFDFVYSGIDVHDGKVQKVFYFPIFVL